MPKAKYVVKLSDEEVKKLKALIQQKDTKTMIRRGYILLDMDENHGERHSQEQVACANAVTRATVAHTVRDYCERGLEEAVKYHKNLTGYHFRKVDDRVLAKIVQVARSPAPEGHARWSVRLLTETLNERHKELNIPVLGAEAVRRALIRANYSLIPKEDAREDMPC